MAVVLAVAAGGAAGSLLRYGLTIWITGLARLGGSGTLAVNVIGAFGLGVLLGLIEARYPSMPRAVSVGIASGVFGGFTTFSSYMADVVAHAEAGRIAVAASLLAATAILGMLAMVAGLAAGRAA